MSCSFVGKDSPGMNLNFHLRLVPQIQIHGTVPPHRAVPLLVWCLGHVINRTIYMYHYFWSVDILDWILYWFQYLGVVD